ncbi:hypothetical protein [Bradyrhizobium sp. WD16]|uniref:hypothetical protein n=1 Tax=Bradyrhizobium sp. WD16 TaxID=1521768 RepID=UPI0020A55EF0|nr:hypothetical protein [Bradyrhizobium sp. WD16]
MIMLVKPNAAWARLKVACLHSLTVAWSYLLAAAGAALEAVNQLGDALGDPQLKQQIADAIGDTTMAARALLAIAAVTFLARIRSLGKQP